MRNVFLILTMVLASPCLAQAQAQTDLTMTRDEFVQSQLNMMRQAKQAQEEMASKTETLMKENMSAEAYAEYKAETEQKQKKQEREVAECLGIPPESMAEMSDKVGPDFQIGVINQCADKLPATINLDGLDWTTNVDFVAYKQCAEALVAKEVGVPAERLEACSRKVQEGQ